MPMGYLPLILNADSLDVDSLLSIGRLHALPLFDSRARRIGLATHFSPFFYQPCRC